MRKKDQINVESKIKAVRFIGEILILSVIHPGCYMVMGYITSLTEKAPSGYVSRLRGKQLNYKRVAMDDF